MHDGGELVAWAVPGGVEDGDNDAGVSLEPLWRAEGQPTHLGVQAVGPDDEVERAPRAAPEGHVHALAVVVERVDGVAVDGHDTAVQRAQNGRRKVDGHVLVSDPRNASDENEATRRPVRSTERTSATR